jgi:hypothetical protein
VKYVGRVRGKEDEESMLFLSCEKCDPLGCSRRKRAHNVSENELEEKQGRGVPKPSG